MPLFFFFLCVCPLFACFVFVLVSRIGPASLIRLMVRHLLRVRFLGEAPRPVAAAVMQSQWPGLWRLPLPRRLLTVLSVA